MKIEAACPNHLWNCDKGICWFF